MDGFAQQLRRHRLDRQMSQEELAQLAGLSVRSVGQLERGRSPRPATVDQLAQALALQGSEEREFVAAGRAQFRAGRADRTQPLFPIGESPPPPRQLPADLPEFVGRAPELASLVALFDRSPVEPLVVDLAGPPGVGKSALAVHLAHRVAARYGDGQVYLVLDASTGEPVSPGQHLDSVLRALGIDNSAIPAAPAAKAAMYRSRVAGKRLLIVIDDAALHQQVEPLLPPAGCAVIVTSRLPLTGLPGVAVVDLSPLPTRSGVDLLARIAGGRRVSAEPAASQAIVAACGGLPLAVRMAGARLAARPEWEVRTLAERLSDESRRLDELRHGDLAVRPVLELAYQALPPTSARAFASLGVLRLRNIPEWALPALLAGPPASAADAWEDLLDARLVGASGLDAGGRPRFRLHDLTRLFAQEKAHGELGETGVRRALARAAQAWLERALVARTHLKGARLLLDDGGAAPAGTPIPRPDPGHPGVQNPTAWFETEREALVSLVKECADAGLGSLAWRLTACCADFFSMRGYLDEWSATSEVALAAARLTDDDSGIIAMLRGAGCCRIELDDWEGALDALSEARERAQRTGRTGHAALAQRDMGFTYAITGRLDQAVPALRDAEAQLDRAGLHAQRAIALTNLGFALREQGHATQAVRTLRVATALAEQRGDRYSHAYASRGLATALLAVDQIRPAQAYGQQAAAAFAEIDDRIGTGQSLRVWGEALSRDKDRSADAEPVLREALNLFRANAFDWGIALTELTLGELFARRHHPEASTILRRSLEYWNTAGIPALQQRAQRALNTIADENRAQNRLETDVTDPSERGPGVTSTAGRKTT
jgi:transcriptional regulator with XRE-family HTH domain/tetratricopeptide (TPR) repeat protein